MKRIFLLLMAGMIMLGAAGCRQTEGQTEETEARESGTQGRGQAGTL